MWRVIANRLIFRTSMPSPFCSIRHASSLRKQYYIMSIIDSYLSLEMVEKATSLFNKYRRQGQRFDVDVYNSILHGWMRKGNSMSAVLFFDGMVDDDVSPNATTYALMLEVYSKSNNWKVVDEIIEEMKKKGYQLQHILHQASLSEAQVSHVKKVLDRYSVESQHPPSKPFTYSKLVESLYCSNHGGETKTCETIGGTDNLSQKCLQRQLDCESRGYERIRSIFSSVIAHDEGEHTNVTVHQLYKNWEDDLTSVLNRDIEEFLSTMEMLSYRDVDPPRYFPFLALLPAKKWAQMLINEVLPILVKQPNGLPLQHICIVLGQSARHAFVLSEYEKNGVIDKIRCVYKDFVKQSRTSAKTCREVWSELEAMHIDKGSKIMELPKWSKAIFYHTVSAVLDRFLQIATFPSTKTGIRKPALEHVVMLKDDSDIRKLGIIRPTKQLYSLVKRGYSKEKDEYFHVSSSLLPMLVPPKPWISPDCGGYLLTPSRIIRCAEDTHQHQLVVRKASNLHAIYDSLNYVSSCPWKINTRILDLVVTIFNGGGDTTLGIPSYPYTKNSRVVDKKTEREQYSLWMDMLYRLSLSSHFKDDVIWLPHNMDFRGRIYPIPPHVSHITMDVGRALMTFACGHPLGADGLNWLKIHLVNLHGLKKKESLEDRLKYANEVMDEVIDSARNPLLLSQYYKHTGAIHSASAPAMLHSWPVQFDTVHREGRKWWITGDNPWQVLACCMEIADAQSAEDPTKFVSCFPVHQDGSCNGLQHYSALGRDLIGAQKVNLLPSDKPEDTYAAVAEMVEEKRRIDAKGGDEVARKLEGHINRKVVKQTVMTIVYGVTRIGGRLQVEKQLKGSLDKDILWDCSNYVTALIFSALKEMFYNARNIQEWLANSARQMSLAGCPAQWETPLGLPVIQPYHKSSISYVKTSLQSLENKTSTDFSYPPDTRKQKMAMPPNYVHSLDSTHMMLTALFCERSGVPFVSVHDCFWTHPCYVHAMNKICREQFVNLHSQPILQDLANYWEHQYGKMKFRDHRSRTVTTCSFLESIPSTGDLDLNRVINSQYFFN